MKIKLAPELKFSDMIVHNHKKYLVNKYSQGLGAGSYEWGEYGILYCNELSYDPHNEKRYIIKPEESWWTYKNYPFIVLEMEASQV